MIGTAAWLVTFGRALLLTAVALPLARAVETRLRTAPERRRPALFTLALLPFVFPALLTGYVWGRWGFVGWPAELLYELLLLSRIVPLGALALLLGPPASATRPARHLWTLRPAPSRFARRSAWHRTKRLLPAAALLFLAAFQEFELAALIGPVSWSDVVLTAHAGGLPIDQSLRWVVAPAVVQLIVLAGVFAITRTPPPEDAATAEALPSRGWAGPVWMACALVLSVGVPLAKLLPDLVGGLPVLLANPLQRHSLGREILTGGLLATAAGLAAWLTPVASASRRPWLLSLLLVPGVLGPLVLALSIQSAVGAMGGESLLRTPAPLLVGQWLRLLPLACLWQFWLNRLAPREALHAASLLADGSAPRQRRHGRRLEYRLRDTYQLLAAGGLVLTAYLDLTLPAILAPTGMATGIVRLYNFMHYGHAPALSAEALTFLCLPLLTGWTLWTLAGRLLTRR